MTLETRSRQAGKATIVALAGSITLGPGAAGLRRSLTAAIEASPRLVLDLAAVDRIDSAGIGELLAAYTSATRKGGAVKLLRPNSRICTLLELTKLDRLLEVFTDEQEAVASFGG